MLYARVLAKYRGLTLPDRALLASVSSLTLSLNIDNDHFGIQSIIGHRNRTFSTHVKVSTNMPSTTTFLRHRYSVLTCRPQ